MDTRHAPDPEPTDPIEEPVRPDGSEPLGDSTTEADEADVAEQSREVPTDEDDHDR